MPGQRVDRKEAWAVWALEEENTQREVLEVVSRASQESLNPNLSRWKGEEVGDSSEEGDSMPAGNKDQNPPPPPKNKVSKLIQMPIHLVRQGWSDVGRHLWGGAVPMYEPSRNSADAHGSASVERFQCFSCLGEE